MTTAEKQLFLERLRDYIEARIAQYAGDTAVGADGYTGGYGNKYKDVSDAAWGKVIEAFLK